MTRPNVHEIVASASSNIRLLRAFEIYISDHICDLIYCDACAFLIQTFMADLE